MPERSFFFHGYQLPVCARCTGIIIGELSGIILCLFRLITPLWVCIGFIGIMAIDGGLQAKGILESTNLRRLVTGLLSGYGFIALLAHILIFLHALLF